MWPVIILATFRTADNPNVIKHRALLSPAMGTSWKEDGEMGEGYGKGKVEMWGWGRLDRVALGFRVGIRIRCDVWVGQGP